MKQPRLPGAEKFKFASSEKHHTNGSTHRPYTSPPSSDHGPSPYYTFHSRTSSVSSQSDLTKPILTTLSVPVLNRTDSKRRAVLPITSKKTSRMLTNTNVELNVDVVPDDGPKLSRLDTSRVPSCPNLDASSRSLHSSKTSLDTYFRKMSLQNSTIQELPPDFDWKNIRASPSRLSASCSSSCSSEESIWVLRKENSSNL